MRYLFFLLFCAFPVFWTPHPAQAQDKTLKPAAPVYETIDDIQKNAYIANPQFEAMARAALNERPHNFDFTEFRSLYAQTRQYDPIGEETVNKMVEIAYHMDTEENWYKNQEYLRQYQNLILNHMANLGVVIQALSLSRTHKRYGDPTFFKWLKAGLIRDVIISGDGYTLNGAYDVVSMAEETVLFNYLGMRTLKTTANKEVTIYYNMHETEDLTTGQKYTIFVNTTLPMKFLEAKANLRRGFVIGVQPR